MRKLLPKELARLVFDGEAQEIKPRIFTVGSLYQISGNPDIYVFQYVGKQGIHHFFREVHGKWTQTYTDYQLFDKKVEEVV